jgi:hypothetical protein
MLFFNLEEQEKQQLKSKLKVPKNTAKDSESKQEVTAQDKKRALEQDRFTSPSKKKTKQEPMEETRKC